MGRIGLQAIYFFILPKLLNLELSAAIFLSFSISSLVPSIASMGSQFSIIRALSLNNEAGFTKANTLFLFGIINILISTPILARIYNNPELSILAFTLLLLSAYVRLYIDTYLQGIGEFNRSQRNYLIYWLAKLIAIITISKTPALQSFIIITLLEVILLPIWILSIRNKFSGIKFSNAVRVEDFKEGVLSTITAFSRGFWLEADKLILPSLISSSAYVNYSLISRVFTAGISLISSFISNITPAIISSKASELNRLWQSGRKNALITLIMMFFGFAVTYFLYPSTRDSVILMIIFAACMPLFGMSSLFLDFIFYRISVKTRLYLNLLGCLMVLIGIYFVKFSNTTVVGVALLVSLLTVQAIASKIVNSGEK